MFKKIKEASTKVKAQYDKKMRILAKNQVDKDLTNKGYNHKNLNDDEYEKLIADKVKELENILHKLATPFTIAWFLLTGGS